MRQRPSRADGTSQQQHDHTCSPSRTLDIATMRSNKLMTHPTAVDNLRPSRPIQSKLRGDSGIEPDDFDVRRPGTEPGGAIQTDLKVKRVTEGKRLDQYLVDKFP